MDRILDELSNAIKDYENLTLPAKDFDSRILGIYEGLIIAKQRVQTRIEKIHREEKKLNIVGVCGMCGLQHFSYTGASKCCNHLKGKDYDEKINEVFKV